MPAVSETTDYAEHFGIWHVLFYGGGGGGSGLPLEIVAFLAHSHPTKVDTTVSNVIRYGKKMKTNVDHCRYMSRTQMQRTRFCKVASYLRKARVQT